ncbi:hypothetical protein [Marispirochaeta sp.]|uniref:hypothetical protein n=1 Tax=Marispirochaeta sp. TaxID=2038653 RepID=UPI0029C703D2|nr:hypothetical protein [Marispirochaeta sp.]
MNRILIVVILLITGYFCVFGQGFFSGLSETRGIPDAVDLRTSLRSSITGSAWTVRRLPAQTYTSETAGTLVRFQVVTQNEALYILLVNNREGSYPLYSAGTYIIKRSIDDGSFIQAKIFLKNDPDTFVRLFPFKDRAKLELYLYGTLIHQDLVLPLSFEELLFSPFSRLVSLTSGRIDWARILPGPPESRSEIAGMIDAVRDKLPFLPDMEDGAMDDAGRFVYIETGERESGGGFNCSGFAKYVADGIYYGRHGRLMPIQPLKMKHPDLRGDPWSRRFEDERDPFFGLDWTRNIGHILNGRANGSYEAMDVRDVPHARYIEDVGYPMEKLKAVLYYLALKFPGSFYLGSVNAQFGTDPVLRQHIHVVVLMPYINRKGDLVAAVFERNTETSVESLLRRYPGENIHLTRVQGSRDFTLPPVPAENMD